MSKLYKRLKSYTKIFLQLSLFIITAIALFFILPGEPKFKYEYQKGFPWRHENLVAPFDFAILKTTQELENEKAEHMNDIVPYFVLDTTIQTPLIMQLAADLNIKQDTANVIKREAFQLLADKLSETYNIGILQFSPNSVEELDGKTEIKKRVGAVVSKTAISLLHSEKTAYNELNAIRSNLLKENQSLPWLQNLPLEKYISANLSFDEITTNKEIDAIIESLSLTRGMVKQGQRIILEGEIVDGEKHQILESLKAS